jgi:hypothetical protein
VWYAYSARIGLFYALIGGLVASSDGTRPQAPSCGGLPDDVDREEGVHQRFS